MKPPLGKTIRDLKISIALKKKRMRKAMRLSYFAVGLSVANLAIQMVRLMVQYYDVEHVIYVLLATGTLIYALMSNTRAKIMFAHQRREMDNAVKLLDETESMVLHTLTAMRRMN